MAKTTAGADASVIRFRCIQCGATLKVSIRQAGRYIDCPKCKNRTQVPASQREADEDARNYEVNQLAYDVTGICRSCGAKMSKKAVVCVQCGFDYRKGKNLEVVDKTKLPSDYPTWKKVFASLGEKDVTNGITQIVSAFVGPLVVGILLFAVAFGVAWWFREPGAPGPTWPFYTALGFFSLGILAVLGSIQQSLVETCGRGMYGRAISGGVLPVAAIYFLINFLVAFLIPALIIGLAGIRVTDVPPDALQEPGVMSGLPNPQFEVANIAALIGGLVLLPLSAFYFFFAVGTFAAETSVNPLRIFGWVGKCAADAAIWFAVSLPFLLLLGGFPALTLWLIPSLELDSSTAIVVWVFVGIFCAVIVGYVCSALAYTMGLVFKRNL